MDSRERSGRNEASFRFALMMFWSRGIIVLQWAISRSSDEQDRRATAASRSLRGHDMSRYSSTAEGMCSKLKLWSLREPRWYLDLDFGLVAHTCGRFCVSTKGGLDNGQIQ